MFEKLKCTILPTLYLLRLNGPMDWKQPKQTRPKNMTRMKNSTTDEKMEIGWSAPETWTMLIKTK